MQRPLTVAEFLRRPTPEEWEWARQRGWAGPDGSSASTDLIFGVRIGITSTDYSYVDLPANRHDWYYQLGRWFRLPEHFRRAADRVYRDLCLEEVRAHLEGPMLRLAILRCHARYVGLRTGARFAWTRRARRLRSAWRGRDR
jgi:hypothetical protein